MGDIHSDLYDDVTSGGSGSYELDYKGETYEFSVTALSRARKNALLDVLPKGYFDPIVDPDELDEEELKDMDMSDLRELFEEAGTSIAEFSKARTMSEEATNEVIDAMVDGYSHPELTDTELRNILRSPKFPDSSFEEMLITLIEESSAGDDIREFRQES